MVNVTSLQLLLSAAGILVLGAVLTAVCKDWRRAGYITAVCAALASLALWILAARAFTAGTVHIGGLLGVAGLNTSLTFTIDRLSATFLMVIPFVSLAAIIYSIDYMAKVHRSQSPSMFYPFVLLLLTAIIGVIASSDLFFFFVFWELMTLMSWVLVWYDREDEVKVRAAWTYFIVTHVAAACILVAALVAYSYSHSFAFGAISKGMSVIAGANPGLASLLMALLLIGFVTKAGMFPFGGWLPQAYPAAPSPASALFAGSMTKLGIYGVIRTTFWFFGGLSMTTTWGGVIAFLGACSIFIGTLAALREDDAKRVLSFHMIGQTGYMLLGVGTGLFFLRTNPIIACVALVGGLYHVVNNAFYKSLLFLNVGATEYWTGTRDLNKLGGLGKYMPFTLAACVIASLSIAGIPPLNGFNSKWLIYQSTINGGISVPIFLVLAVVAMFISLVTLASFMKLLGSVFLGQAPHYPHPPQGEVPWSMRIGQGMLAVACVVLGVAPILALTIFYGAVTDAVGSATPGFAALFGTDPTGISLTFGKGLAGVWNPYYVVVALLLCGGLGLIIARLGKARAKETVGWYCGEEAAPEEIRYRAHGFCLPFKEAFKVAYPSIKLPKAGAVRWLQGVFDVDRWLYNPLVSLLGRATDGLSKTHSGVPQMYMLWQLAGIIVVFAVLLAWLG